MNFYSDIKTPHLKSTAPDKNKQPIKAIQLINDPITPRAEIDLPALIKEEGLNFAIAAQYSVGHVVSLIHHNKERRVDIHCGNPEETRLFGFRHTPEAIQVPKDVQYLMTESIETIQNRTGKTISVSQFDDPLTGTPVISYKVVEN